MQMRILIVDDSDAIRGFLRGMMHDLNHDTCESSNGFDAVDRYQEFHPDLVLMDIRMPRMDGIEATERIRQIDPQAQVAIVTEVDEKLYRDSALNAGAVGYILKDDLRPLLSFINAET
jgi:CheY-like chemotaxis protein